MTHFDVSSPVLIAVQSLWRVFKQALPLLSVGGAFIYGIKAWRRMRSAAAMEEADRAWRERGEEIEYWNPSPWLSDDSELLDNGIPAESPGWLSSMHEMLDDGIPAETPSKWKEGTVRADVPRPRWRKGEMGDDPAEGSNGFD